MPAASGNQTVEPCVIVIFGASGDLTHRKLIPSLYDLERQGVLPRGTVILGVSRTPLTDDQFREKLAPSVEKFSAHYETGRWRQFAQRVHYHPGDASSIEDYPALSKRINDLAQGAGILKPSGSPNILFYLSVSPDLYEPIVECIGSAGMIT
jgi:glucose-6-phosphate 1-dehydrogenase